MADLLPSSPPRVPASRLQIMEAVSQPFDRLRALGGPFFFDDRERAAGSPLVERLFAIPGVANVLIVQFWAALSQICPIGRIENHPHGEGSTVSTALLQWHELGEVGVRLSHISAVSIVKPHGTEGFGYTVNMIGGQSFNILFGEQSAAETGREELIRILTDLVPG